MTAILALVFTVAAAARLTRLIVKDKITEPIRAGIARRLKQPEFSESGRQISEGSRLTYLIHCGWCTGMWVSAAVGAAAWWGGVAGLMPGVSSWFGYPALALATGWFVGILQRIDE